MYNQARKSDLVDIQADGVIHSTEKAYLFKIGDKKVWIPFSQCEWDEDKKIITMPYRTAYDKELI